MLAYLDPGSGPSPLVSVLVVVLLVVVALSLLGATIYVAVRLANRKRD
jgi:hypothetical protein